MQKFKTTKNGHLLAPSPDSCLHLMVESLGSPNPNIQLDTQIIEQQVANQKSYRSKHLQESARLSQKKESQPSFELQAFMQPDLHHYRKPTISAKPDKSKVIKLQHQHTQSL